MKISVVIVCLDEAHNIGPCLRSVLAQEYPAEDVEILVIDGDSRDGTQEAVRALAAQESRLRLIVEPRPGAALARRVGVEQSCHDYIAFTDADCRAPPDWLTTLADGFRRHATTQPRLAAVGGRNIAGHAAAGFQRAIEIALDTFIGSLGSVQGRQYESDRSVDSLATLNVLYRREALIAAGNFDAELRSLGEDADMNFRLRAAGYELVYLADAVIHHEFRGNQGAWLRNMVRYGSARALLLKRHGRAMLRPTHLLPPLFLALFALLPLAWWHPLFILPLAYFPTVLLLGLLLALGNGATRLTLPIASVFVTTHFGYAWGLVSELLSPRRSG